MGRLRRVAWLLLWAGCGFFGAAAASAADLPDGLYAEITTPRGTVVAELFYRRAPLTVANFVGLAEGRLGPDKGRPFYDGLTFHRVVAGFVVQGGDPLGTGGGGPGYTLPDEFAPGLHHDAGVLSMANDGSDTNGSQFFITLTPVRRLDYLHSVFGKTIRGFDVVARIEAGDVMRVKIRRVGTDAIAFQADEEAVAVLSAKARAAGLADKPRHFEDPAAILPVDPPRARYFDLKLANFERFTGRKIYARLFPSNPAEGGSPSEEPLAVAERLDVLRRGVLALYFKDRDEWRLSVGEEDVPLFNPSSKQTLREREQEFFANVRKTAEAAIDQAGEPVTDAQRIKFQTDAVIDALIAIFEPKTTSG